MDRTEQGVKPGENGLEVGIVAADRTSRDRSFVRRTGSCHPMRLYSLLFRMRRVDGRPRSPWIGRRNSIRRRRARSFHASIWTAGARGRSSAARRASIHARSPEDMRSGRRHGEVDGDGRTAHRRPSGPTATRCPLWSARYGSGCRARRPGATDDDRARDRGRDCGHSQNVRWVALVREREPSRRARLRAFDKCAVRWAGANARSAPSRVGRDDNSWLDRPTGDMSPNEDRRAHGRMLASAVRTAPGSGNSRGGTIHRRGCNARQPRCGPAARTARASGPERCG